MKEKKDDRIRCPKCGSTQVYIRVSVPERFCRICGYSQPLKVEDMQDEKQKG